MNISEGRYVVRWYLSVPICWMESDGVHRSPMSTGVSNGITGSLVVNLASDKCSICEIWPVLKVLKQKSPFQAWMTSNILSF